MRSGVVRAIVGKDFREFGRNRFFLLITFLVLVVWVVVFWVLPDSVDETLRIGVSGFEQNPVAGQEGIEVVAFASAEELRVAVEEGSGDVVAGIAFPPGFAEAVAAGEQPTVVLYVPAGLPASQQTAMESIVAEVAFAFAGAPPPVNPITEAQILGVDRVGAQISLQQQMRPLLLVLVLMVETIALSAIVATEVQLRTVTAILATPARVVDFITAKGVFGTALAFSEAALLALLIGALTVNAPAVLVTLLLGAVLVTGLGMVAGTFGRDFMETMFVAILFLIPLMVPAFGALFPGSSAWWVKLMPSYGLVQAVQGVTIDGESWSEIAGALALLAGWSTVAFAVGAWVLRRRVVTL